MTEKVRFSKAELGVITLALGLGTFIQILDTSIANVAIPAIAGDLGASPDQGTWVITSFAVSNAIVLPLTGWLAMRFGEVRIFTLSTVLFSLFSWLCGMATSLPMLIVLRVLQGASGGALLPLSQSLLLQNYPPEKKGLALGLWSIVVIVAPLLGPILGGWITEDVGWPWIFYINVPLGFLSALLVWNMLSGKDNATKRVPVDTIGLCLLVIGVGCLQIALDKGNELDWFESNQIIILSLLAGLGLLLFICWNSYSDYPVVDFSFFYDRNFTIATLLSAIGFILFFGSVIIQPLWLQTWQGYTAIWAGVTVAPFGIFTILLSPIVGHNIHKMDARILVTCSFIILAISNFWISGFNTQVSLIQIIIPRILQGLGLAFFFIPLLTLALSDIPNSKLSSASGVYNFFRLISGGGIGTALFVNFWTRWGTYHHSTLAESVNVYSPNTLEFLEGVGTAGIMPDQSYNVMELIVGRQAALLSINDLFWISGWIFLVLCPAPWLCKPLRKKEGPVFVSE